MADGRERTEVAQGFRGAMSQLATGVVLVTTQLDGKPWGATVSACCSVSMDPPLLLVSLAKGTATEQALTRERRFGVSVLDQSLLHVAKFGSEPGRPKFIAHLCENRDEGDLRPPAVAGAPVHIDCDLHKRVDAGDHVLFLGHVQEVTVIGSERPLLYFGRQFRTLDRGNWMEVDYSDGAVALLNAGYHW